MRFMKLLTLLTYMLVGAGLSSAAVPIGHLQDVGSNGTVWGWAQDPDVPNTAINVDVYADSTFCGRVLANYYYGPTVGSHGFRYTLPESARYSAHYIYAYGIDASGGDPNTAIDNGNPFPTIVDVSANDRAYVHSGGEPMQLGTVFGGRPGNFNFSTKTITSAKWIGTGQHPWYETGDTAITLTSAPRMAGGISSIIWDNVQFVEAITHGAGVQYVTHDTRDTEQFNPTEAGSQLEDAISYYGESLINLYPLAPSQNPPDPVTGNIITHSGRVVQCK